MQLDLARWQFAFISVNHFFFVPVTIGLAFLTALLQPWRGPGGVHPLSTALLVALFVRGVAFEYRGQDIPGAAPPVAPALG